MKRVRVDTYSGAIKEVEMFNVRDGQDIKTAKPPKERFKDKAEYEAHKLAISRKKHTQLFNANFDHNCLYVTLTLDNENEVHYYEDMKRLRDNYIRRLQRQYPDAVIFAYIGKGKNSRRFHMHMVVRGIPEGVIREKWGHGRIDRIEFLREHNIYDGVDHGEDYQGLANYLFDHWEQEFGGHRWKMTRNHVKPIKEEPREIKRNYSEQKPPRTPKGYMLVETKSNQYGYLYFRYVKIPGTRYETRKRKEREKREDYCIEDSYYIEE